MAEEILLLTVKLQADSKNAKTINDLIKANKELAKVIKNAPLEGSEGYEELAETLKNAKKQFSDNKKEIDKFNKSLNSSDDELKKTKEEVARLNKELKENEKALKDSERQAIKNQKEVDRLAKAFLDSKKQVDVNKTSLAGLSLTLKNLEKEYKLLSKEERETAKGRFLEKSIFNTRQELLKAEKKLGDFRRQVGNYGIIVAGLSPQLSALGSSVGTLVSGFTALNAAFKNSGAAAKAFLLALGPVTVAIGALSFALSKFESVRESFQRGFAGIGAAFNVVIERVGQAAFSFEKLLSLDFKGFAADFGGAFRGLTDEIKNDFNAASAAMLAMQELEDDEIARIIELAELERDIAIAKREAEEASATNKAAAVSQIEEAIRLTERQFAIEIDFARRRAEILAEELRIKGDTVKDEEIRLANEARANQIRLEAAQENEIKGLTRRLNQLRKGVKDEQTALQVLQQQQSSLTETLKLQILAGEDTAKTLDQLKAVTLDLIAVDETFKALTDSIGVSLTFTNGSLQQYNKELETQNSKLETLVIGSKEYEETQNLILQTEAKRSVAIGEVTKSIEELNKVQEASKATLEDSLKELRLREAAQKALESSFGTEGAAQKKIDIERQLNEDLKQIRIDRILAEQEALETELNLVDADLQKELELYKDNELKKLELSLIAQGKQDEIRQRSLELESEFQKISLEKFKEFEEQKTEDTKKSEEQRNSIRDIAIQGTVSAAKKVTELLGVLQKQATEKELNEINTREERQLREAELLGKTEEQKQAIRDKFAAEREALERKAASERKAIAIGEAVIDIAGAVLNALNSPAPANFGLAITAGVLGALQLAIIAATNFANGGLVTPVKLGNGKIVNSPNIPQMENGDNILATVKTGEVILNEKQQAALGGYETFKRIKVPGFSSGGKVTQPLANAFPFAAGGAVPSFSRSPIVARAFAGGGAVTAQNSQQMVQEQSDAFIQKVADAVRIGAAIGSEEGTKKADITGQIAKQNQRDARRTKNEGL